MARSRGLRAIRTASKFCLSALFAAVAQPNWVAQPYSSGVTDDGLGFWLVLNIPAAAPGAPEPALDVFLEDWARQGVDLFGLRTKATENREFRHRLLGQGQILRQLALFRQRNPSFPRIKVLFFDWDEYWESLRSVSPDLRPDLIQVPTSWCSSLAGGLGILDALSEETHREAVRRYDRKLLEPCLLYGEGPLYGLPWMVDVRVLYFWRKDLPTLEREVRNSPNARDGFRRALQSAPDAGHALFAVPTARDWELLHQTALLVWGHGGELIETRRWLGYRSGSAALNDAALRAAEYLRTLAGDHLIALPRETRQELEEEFIAHRLGSIISGPWLLSELETRGAISDGSVGMILPPLYERDPVTFVGGSLLGVTGRNPMLRSQALELARHFSAGMGSLPTAIAAGLIPASKDAMGTATEAAHKLEELKSGRPCSTYFECIIANVNTAVVPEVFERALKAGRTYPAIPNWWTLEVPSRLGSLYHFWQELAALQPRSVLEGSLRAISDDWDVSLRGSRRWVIGISIAAVVISLVVVFGVLWARRYRHRLRKREEDISASIRYLESQVAREREASVGQQGAVRLLQQILSEVRKKENELTAPAKYVKGKFEDFVAPLQEPDHFEIVLPTYADVQLKISKNGRAVGEVNAMAARIIERVVRQSLIERRPMSFSLLLGGLYFWPSPESLPKDPAGRWEAIVTAIRDGFDSKRLEVISKGRSTIYDFLLNESAYNCYISADTRLDSEPAGRRFVTRIRTPYLDAERLALSDSQMALSLALDAFAAEQELVTKDVEVTILACRLGSQASGAISEKQRLILRDAQEELSRVREQYDVFFENYASPEDVLQTAGGFRRHERELRNHWNRLRETWSSIKEAAESISVDVAAPPESIEKEWRTVRHLVKTLGIDRAQKHSDFVDAYIEIRGYWGRVAARGALGRLTELTERLDRVAKFKRRFQSWAQHCLSSVVLTAVETGEGSDRIAILSAVEFQLASDFWRAVEDAHDNILLEMISDGDEKREANIRAALKTRTVPHDINGCIQVLDEMADAPA